MIDELQRVKNFRTSEPGPGETVRDTARSALIRAAAEERTGPPRVRPRRLPRLRVVAIAAAAVGVAVLVLAVFGWGGSPAGPSPAAAAVLDRLARLISAQPLAPQPGQYLYVESRSEYPAFAGNCETLAVDHRHLWIGADGSGLLREITGPEHFSSSSDRATCLQATPNLRLGSGGTSNLWFAPHCFALGPTSNWSSLSSDPRVLLEQMRHIDGGPRTAREDFVHIGDFLRETDAPPAVRATLYRAAALIPGVQLLGTVRDHDGRSGLGIAYASHGSIAELIFDPQTGELLGEQGNGPRYWAVYLREQVVDALPSKPPAPLTPACVGYGGTIHQTPEGDVMTGAGGSSTLAPAHP